MSADTGSAVVVSAGCKDRGLPMCDCLSASDDLSAVGVLDQPGGPDASGFDVVPLKGIATAVLFVEHDEWIAFPRSSPRGGMAELFDKPTDFTASDRPTGLPGPASAPIQET
ncbi:hypothetical protein [Streptomyces violascens]|uniref:hypothetical protein n=1 Tax=Streptomyces violascens TaxID=67381 RepID=UPI003648CE50